MKKIIGVILSVLLIVCVLPIGSHSVSALQSGNYTYTVSNGEATITDFNYSYKGSLTIPATLGGYPVTKIGSMAFYQCYNLTSVTIPSSVKVIDYAAFGYCSNISKVTIPSTVTYIGAEAFYNCTYLSSITLPTAIDGINAHTFYNCSSLKSIIFPDNIKYIDKQAFLDCTSLSQIVFSGYMEQIGYDAFYNTAWYNNKSAGPVYIDKVLYSYKGDIPAQFTVSDGIVGIAGKVFYGSNIEIVTLPSSITNVGYEAFGSCSSLSRVNVSNVSDWAAISFETAGSNPLNCGALLYENGNMITDITISDIEKVGSNAFINYKFLESVMLSSSIKEIGKSAFYGCSSLECFEFSDSLVSIGEYAFSGCDKLDNISFPNTLQTISASAFENCYSISEIVIPSSVTEIGGKAFYKCNSIENLFIEEGITSISFRAFEECTNIKYVSVPKSLIKLGDWVFYNCVNIKNVYYAGTLEEWKAIRKGYGSVPFENANIYHACTCGNSKLTDWVIKREPTCVFSGEMYRYCESCEEAQYAELAFLGHNVSGDVCIDCGVEITVVESEHDYLNNTDKTWTVRKDDAQQMMIQFSKETNVQSNYDFIEIYDANNLLVGKYTSLQLSNKSLIVSGDTVKIRLVSDASVTYYGFYAEISPIIEDCGHFYENFEIITAATFDKEGLRNVICSKCGEYLRQEVSPELVLGDANRDGLVNSIDLVKITSFLLNASKIDCESALVIELNGINGFDIRDLVAAKNILAN